MAEKTTINRDYADCMFGFRHIFCVGNTCPDIHLSIWSIAKH